MAPVEIGLSKGDRFGLAQGELLHTCDLRAASLKLVHGVAISRGCRRHCGGAWREPPCLVLAAPAEALRALSHFGFTSTRRGESRQRGCL